MSIQTQAGDFSASGTRSLYRWVVAIAGGFGLAAVILPIPLFGSAIPEFSKSWGDSLSLVTAAGMDSYALGVLCTFLFFHTGIAHGRVNYWMTGLLLLQVVPLLLIPHLHSLLLLAVLRFLMGWGLAVMGLQASLLVRWFPREERALCLAFPIGFALLGLVPGGAIASAMPKIGLTGTFDLAAAACAGCGIVYALLSREATSNSMVEGGVGFGDEDSRVFRRIWSSVEIWLVGIGGISQTWALFTVGTFLPIFFIRFGGLSIPDTGRVMTFFGLSSFVIILAGAFANTALIYRRGRSAQNAMFALHSRLCFMIAANIVTGVGFAFLDFLLLHHRMSISVAEACIALGLVGFFVIYTNLFWVVIGDLFPARASDSRLLMMAVFVAGLLAQVGSVIGPFISSYLVAGGWQEIFLVAIAMQIMGIATCSLLLWRTSSAGSLPFEQ